MFIKEYSPQQGGVNTWQKKDGIIDVWRKILARESVFSLWRGLVPTLMASVPFAAIQFYLYSKLMTLSERVGGKG